MSLAIRLPDRDGSLVEVPLHEPGSYAKPEGPPRSRIAYAAAHVAADPLGGNVPGAPAAIDWESTLAFRRHLWSYGLGVAEAMDTAQRGMSLDWPAARELITRSAAEAASCGGRIAAGAGSDQRADVGDLAAVVGAYEEQLEVVEGSGATVVLMASRELARVASDADDYHRVYGRLLEQVARPVILHWLGPMFDPALAGYWGDESLDTASESLLALVNQHTSAVDGVKISLLDAPREVTLRNALPDGVRLYTGDDFNYPELIRGDEDGASDALLGVFAAIAPAASAALQALDAGDLDTYGRVFDRTLPLARRLFEAPTYHYKAGIAFLAWICGHQPGFTMLGGLQSARDIVHLSSVFRLANAAGLLPDPELAVARMGDLLAVAGVRS